MANEPDQSINNSLQDALVTAVNEQYVKYGPTLNLNAERFNRPTQLWRWFYEFILAAPVKAINFVRAACIDHNVLILPIGILMGLLAFVRATLVAFWAGQVTGSIVLVPKQEIFDQIKGASLEG